MIIQVLSALVASAACLVQAEAPERSAERPVSPLQALVGDYYMGDGLGVNRSLTITHDGRFEFESRGCLGLYDCNSGAAEVIEGHLVLKPERVNLRRIGLYLRMLGEGLLDAWLRDRQEPGGDSLRLLLEDLRDFAEEFKSEGTPTGFIPVAWGERQFLVADEEGRKFCNCVNQGLFSLAPHRNFYLRRGDAKKRADGLPAVPERWKSMLLIRPISGKVVEILKAGRAKVDFGTENGAWKGMEIWIDSAFGWAEVVEAEAKTCTIEVFRDEAWAKVGRSVRSRKPGAD